MRLFEIDKIATGTYAGVRFDQKTLEQLATFQSGSNIPNPLDPEKMHSTMVYSRNALPDYKSEGNISPVWKGTFKGFDIFGDEEEDEYCLVMLYDCPEMSAKFDDTMANHDATWDHDGFHPHITLSYDVGPDFNLDNLPDYEGPINISSEYSEDLELE